MSADETPKLGNIEQYGELLECGVVYAHTCLNLTKPEIALTLAAVAAAIAVSDHSAEDDFVRACRQCYARARCTRDELLI